MAFLLTITESEMLDLGWIADRYDSARVLFDNLVSMDQDDDVYLIQEHAVWEALEATETDGGSRYTIPCLGGELNQKIQDLFQNIV